MISDGVAIEAFELNLFRVLHLKQSESTNTIWKLFVHKC